MLDKLINKLKKTSPIEQNNKYASVFLSIEQCVSEKENYVYSHSRLPFNECDGYQELKK